MRHIYAIGECIFDIAFKDDKILFAQPGGSKLNTAVSLGRINLPVSLISECSDDALGNRILSFLQKNNVATGLIASYHGQVRLALAFLDQGNNASYTFYTGKTQERIVHRNPGFSRDDIILFGSFYSLKPENRQRIRQLIRAAQASASMLIYDPNYRTPHIEDLETVRPFILGNIRAADIVRGSDEDFWNIFHQDEPERIHEQVVNSGGKILILTQGQRDVLLYAGKIRKAYTVTPVQTISTIGAGDNFNAGIITELVRKGIRPGDLHSLDEPTWDGIIHTALSFASHVCCEVENYISGSFADDMNSTRIMTMNNKE